VLIWLIGAYINTFEPELNLGRLVCQLS